MSSPAITSAVLLAVNRGNSVPAMTPGDALAFVAAFADEVALRVEKLIGCSERMLDIDQAARYLGMTPVALRHKVAAGGVPVVKEDRKLRFDRRALDRYIDHLPTENV